MFEMESLETTDKPKMYDLLARQARALLEGETDPVANAANLAALIFHQLPNLNWAGIYFLQDQELLIGPFQGQPACVRIPLGQGVCGSAAAARKTIVVDDVDEFPGHIPCDSASRSELVVPLIDAHDRLIGVLDLDSPVSGRFDLEDAAGVELLAGCYMESVSR
ncbi:MAG: GAF domain-containing protein [Gammaproteobacteria bacterium]|nr:MAG: GAF domain-containing protein [Gammaproteobacteria bacterium]